MNRRTLLGALGACALGVPLAHAQRQGKLWRVGILSARPVESLDTDRVYGAFMRGMRELGYVQGENLAIELRAADLDYERLPALAEDLVQLKVDLILVAGAPTVRAAQKATTTIPIVIGTAGDPVGSGFVQSLARPGGNITGLTDAASDMGFKLLDLLLSAVPGLNHVAVLKNPGNPSHATFVASIQQGARANRVKMLWLDARSEREVETAFARMAKEKVRGVIALADPAFNTMQPQIAQLAAKYRLPCISGLRQYVHAGGLMTYGPDFAENFRRAAAYVDKIFRGAKPGELPVEQATRIEFAVNLKTAKALGLVFPGALLARADEIVER